MAINRIENFKIEEKHLFSGIYGKAMEDVFIDEDLRCQGVYEALYCSLHEQGYTVVFYSQDPRRNFFSFRKNDLATLYNLTPRKTSENTTPTTQSTNRYVANIRSPFGNRRRAMANSASSIKESNKEEPEYDQIQTEDKNQHTFYRIADTVDPFLVVTNYIGSNPEKKTAFIFATGSSDRYSEEQTNYIDSMFETLRITFASRGIQARIIILYNCASSGQIFTDGHDTYFTNKHFRNKFLDANSGGSEEGSANPSFDLYEIPGPDAHEFRNMLNRRRLKESFPIFDFSCGIEGASIRLSQEVSQFDTKKRKANPYVEQMSHYVKLPINSLYNMIEKFNTDKAIDRLRSMSGMESVIAQLEHFIEALRESKNGNSGPRFRPHLVFSGNPGTGKTTVARLLADILREEGLLERGHLIEATVGDLEGEYIGQTRIKTQALCDRARGGVLFIDEAYGLMSGSNHGDHADYGKEAIEVLIQFMENSSDSLVILGGYKDEMENLIKNGNQGFMRRFNGKESFIQFEDYNPDALYSIFLRQIKYYERTEEFLVNIRNIINYQYSHRNVRWGNAGEMEKLASAIISQHRRNKSKGGLDVSDIPENFMRIISPAESVDDILKEIDNLVGLNGVKHNLRTLIKSAMGQRRRALRYPNAAIEKKNLNFVFTGAPGTGKTTVANLMAKILYRAGLIDNSDKAVVVQKGDIIKSGVGDTPKAIKQLFNDNAGKVIFIDEAYGLTQHGSEAIDEITNCLTDTRFMGNQAVILAGYTQEMNRMLATNRGLRSRFENHWFFEDYSNEDLWSIFTTLASQKGLGIADEAICSNLADNYFDEERRVLGTEFSNARKANQLFSIVSNNYDIREFEENVTDLTLRPIDFPNYREGNENLQIQNQSDTPSDNYDSTNDYSFVLDVSLDNDDCKVADPSHFSKSVGLLFSKTGVGTAFVISVTSKLILTAYHVVHGENDFKFIMERGGFTTPAKVVWTDSVADLAILQVESLPTESKYFAIDHRANEQPALLEPIIHCGFVKGLSVSDNFQVYEGKISGYDEQKQVTPQNRFDAILSDIAAINGCSGGPVMRKSDMVVIGILQGGFEGAPTRIIVDTHQLHKNNNLTIIR